MLELATFLFVLVLGSTAGHNGNQQSMQSPSDDGILQADLMPQELQSGTAGDKVEDPNNSMLLMGLPFRPLLSPYPRIRRSAPAAEIAAPESPDSPVTSVAEQVKQYSRVIACFVLVVSAVIEVVVYIIEAYQVEAVPGAV